MPNLAASFTVDTSTTVGNCTYELTPIGGVPVATSIVAGGTPLTIIAGNPYDCTDVVPINKAPLGIPPCPAGTRTVKAEVNTTVLIDGKYPVVSGDETILLGSYARPLTGPYQQLRIVLGSNTN